MVAAAGYQPTAEELLEAARDAKSQNPDFGVKRVWTLLKEKGWVVSEARVKKIMQENGLSESAAPSAAIEGDAQPNVSPECLSLMLSSSLIWPSHAVRPNAFRRMLPRERMVKQKRRRRPAKRRRQVRTTTV